MIKLSKFTEALREFLLNNTKDSSIRLKEAAVEMYKAAKEQVEKEEEYQKKWEEESRGKTDEEKFEIQEKLYELCNDKLLSHYVTVLDKELDELFEELQSVNLTDPKLFDNSERTIREWDPGPVSPEESASLAHTQAFLLDNAPPLFSQLRQLRLINILNTLHFGLSEGARMLKEKEKELSDLPDTEKTSKIEILIQAFSSMDCLAEFIKQKIETEKAITQETVSKIYSDFTIVKKKVIQLIAKIPHEEGLFSPFKEWLSDTTKEVFSFGKLSTKGTLNQVAADNFTLFRKAKREVRKIFPELMKQNKKYAP